MNRNQLKAGYLAFFKQKMLALLLIDKNKNFANTYDLIRVLSRMVGLFACSGISKVSNLKVMQALTKQCMAWLTKTLPTSGKQP